MDPQVGGDVPDKQVRPTKVLAHEKEDGGSDEQTEIAQQDQMLVLLLIQRAVRHEVVDTTEPAILLTSALTLELLVVVVVASHVVEQVHGPASELLTNKSKSSHNGRVLHQLGQLMHSLAKLAGVLLSSPGNKDHVALDVAGGLVMLAVGDLPGEIRDEQGGVAEPADGVVEGLGRGEGLVTALVSQHPKTGTDETLDNGVHGPETRSDGVRRDSLWRHKVVEEIEGGGEAGDVSGDIVEAGRGRPLEAVRRDGISDLLDGVVGHLELVSIPINQPSSLVFQRQVVDRVE